MKQLCIDVRMGFNSGIGTYVRNLVEQLKEGPFKLVLIAHIEMVEKWPALKGHDLILTAAPLYSIEEQLKLPFLIPDCDFFWSPHYNIPLLPIRAKKRIVTIHDVYHIAFSKTLSFHKRMYAKTVIHQAVTRSDAIFTISNFSKEEIIKYTGAKRCKISVIPLGVDKDHFKSGSAKADLEKVKHKYHLPDRFFLFVSNLAPHKNIDRMITAWNSFTKTDPDWKLVLVGKNIKGHAWNVDPDKVMFLGHVDYNDLPLIYQLSYATIHPSLYEGFGLTPLEAMSCGSPVVVSKVASLPEVCGECAIYVNPYSVDDIVDGIQKMVSDQQLRSALREKGLQRSQAFNWHETARRHIEVIEALG